MYLLELMRNIQQVCVQRNVEVSNKPSGPIINTVTVYAYASHIFSYVLNSYSLKNNELVKEKFISDNPSILGSLFKSFVH